MNLKIDLKQSQKMFDLFKDIFDKQEENGKGSLFTGKSILNTSTSQITSIDLGDLRFTKTEKNDKSLIKFTLSKIIRDSIQWSEIRQVKPLLTIKTEKDE
jgi:hypothetical protein